jgi:RNA polymerase sigma-70 factor (ECF subfamily)
MMIAFLIYKRIHETVLQEIVLFRAAWHSRAMLLGSSCADFARDRLRPGSSLRGHALERDCCGWKNSSRPRDCPRRAGSTLPDLLAAALYLRPHDAQDLTQSFFAYLIERKIYARTDPQKGKFRSFLLASLKHFLSHAREREQTLKRGGGRDFVPLEEGRAEDVESLFQTRSSSGSSALPKDKLFERTWAETLVATALGRLAAAYKSEGKENVFESFQMFLTVGADPLPTYSELAARLSVSESTIRSRVTRLRAHYREMLRAEVRRTVDTDAEVDEELRELLRVLIEN